MTKVKARQVVRERLLPKIDRVWESHSRRGRSNPTLSLTRAEIAAVMVLAGEESPSWAAAGRADCRP